MPKSESPLYSLKEEYMDIYTLPTPTDCPPSGSILVLGDSHGRFTKLMAELWEYCVISNITASQHQALIRIQQKSGDELSTQDLTLFENILKVIVVNPTLKIILTDDFVADRGDADERNYSKYKGGNDYLNLKFLKALSLAKTILAICYSNHGVELIDRYERGLKFTESRFQTVHDHFFNTARQLQRLIDRGLVDRKKEVDPLIKNHYIAYLQVLVYCRNFLITHAPAGLPQIEKLAQQFNISIPYDIHSEEFKSCHYEKHKLLQMINGVNTIFKSHAQKGTIHKIHDYYNYNQENMLDFFTHNRDHNLERSECLYQANGHDADTKGLDPSHVFSLNSPLGQGRCPEKTCSGTNRVLILYPEQQEEQPAEEAQPTNEPENYSELWDSLYDIYSSIISAGVNGFIAGAALSLFGTILEKYTRLEKQQINQLKSALSGIFILYGLFMRDSEQLQAFVWNMMIRYIARSIPNIADQNGFLNIAATSTTAGMAIAASSSNTWTSFLSQTATRAASSISAYYGYSLGSTLFNSSTEQHEDEAKHTDLRKEIEELKQENKIMAEKITALEAEKNVNSESEGQIEPAPEEPVSLSASKYITFHAPSSGSNGSKQPSEKLVLYL